MPPPSHVHPGLLVTNKPDLPRAQVRSPPAAGPACSLARGSNGTADKCVTSEGCKHDVLMLHEVNSVQQALGIVCEL